MSKSTISTIVAVLALIVAGVALATARAPEPMIFGNQGVSNFDSIHLSDLPEGTATPVLVVDEQSGGSANIVEVRAASTPVWYVDSSGNTIQTGTDTRSSTLDMNGNKIDLDADADTSITADTDDQIDIEVSGADDFQITANTFTALSGSSLAANTIAETTGASGVTIDGLTLKDGGIQDAGGLPVTGQADAEQLVVTGYTTQTNSVLVVEDSSNADIFEVTTSQINANNNPIVNIGAAGTDFSSSGGLTTAAGVTISDGNAQVNDFIVADAASAIDATSDAVITPTGTYQQLTATGATTPTVTTTDVTAGTVLVLINTAAQDILIQDSGTMALTGDVTLNQYDSLTLWFDGTNWIEISASNN